MAVSWPFDSTLTQDENGNPVYSKAYSSDVIAKILAKYFRNGVYLDVATSFQVVTASGMTVKVHPGYANLNGRQVYEEAERVLTVQAADANLDRIDSVVLRLNLLPAALSIDLYVVQGTAAASPVAPQLTRNASLWELGLANLFIAKGTSGITQERITDTRLDSARCGAVATVIADTDTSAYYAQIAADLAAFRTGREADFDAWFASIRSTLGSDAAGSLLAQIQELDARKQALLTSASPLSVSLGGTGANTKSTALKNLGGSRLAAAGSATGIANITIPAGSNNASVTVSASDLTAARDGVATQNKIALCSLMTSYPQGRSCSIGSLGDSLTVCAGLPTNAASDTLVVVRWLVLYL